MTPTQILHQFAVKNKLVAKYLLNELSGADLEDFELHIWDCPRCSEEVQAGQAFTQCIAAGVEAPRQGSMTWWQRIKEFFGRKGAREGAIANK